MTPPVHEAAAPAPAPPVGKRKFRFAWHHLYFGLAGFDLLTVGTSLYLSHHLNSVFERSVQANEVGLQRMASYAELGQLASLVNTPGNDVFDSRDVAQERGRLTDELRVFSAAMGEARQDALAINEPVGPALRDGLNEVETKMTSMVDEAQSIFTFFDRNEPEKAGERMATMDRRYAEVLSAVRTLQQAARDDLQAKVREQAAYAADLRSLELVIGGAVVLMIGGIGYYGHRMSRSMRESALAMAKSMTADLAAAKRRAEDSLRETEALRFTVDAQSIVSVTDTRGQIIDINDTFCRISGYSRAELLGQDHRVLNSGRHPKAFWVEMWRTVAGGESWRGEVCNRAKDGSLYWVDSIVAPFVGADGRIEKYVSIRTDITARKRAEALLQATNEELVVARHAAEAASMAKSEFLANMSHEIRTPLTAVLGYADLLAEDGDGTSAQCGQTIDTIRNAGKHLLVVINDILDLSKIEAGQMTVERIDTPLVGILSEVESLMRPRAAGKGLRVTTAFGTAVPERILSDPTRLRQILMNLVGNAVKFTEEGTVTSTVSVAGEGASQRLLIDVEDSGPGMTADQAGRLFQAFGQADATVTRRHGGTGLGLMISRRLADMMGGEVVLMCTELGKGSCFRIILPIEPAPGAAMIDRLEAVKATTWTKAAAQPACLAGRILLVEDGADNQRLIAFHLKKAGAEVDVAENGKIALEMLDKAAAQGRPFDLLLTDMQMPVMDGYALARVLRSRGSTLAIVALTAHAMAEDHARCCEAGCDDYATKPIDKVKLLEVCAKWMGKRGGGIAAQAA